MVGIFIDVMIVNCGSILCLEGKVCWVFDLCNIVGV